MTTPTPASLPTRQQLDEIDALLRRMLSLPSMSSEPVAASPPAPLTTATFPAPVIREVPPQQPPLPNDPQVQGWRVEWPQASMPPAAAAPPTSVVSWGTAVPPPVQHTPWTPPQAPAPQLPRLPFAAPVPTGDATTLPVATPVAPLKPESESTSLLVWFLIVLNATFNFFTYLLGPLGGWLRGSGRNVLGAAGVIMILAGVVWALGNFYGYEWPKIPLDRLKIPR